MSIHDATELLRVQQKQKAIYTNVHIQTNELPFSPVIEFCFLSENKAAGVKMNIIKLL
jgi:hypothetical protein